MPFFSTAPATTEIYTLSLHDALPICGSITSGISTIGSSALYAPIYNRLANYGGSQPMGGNEFPADYYPPSSGGQGLGDRKSTRLNSSHSSISYAVFCLKKKKHAHDVV